MKTNKKFLFVTMVLLVAYVLSACGGVPAAAPAEQQAAVKVDASLVAYTGTLEGINGDQWIVNGQALTVDPTVVRDGPFQVGDTIKVEGNVNPDGSFTVSRIEAPSASDLTELPQLGNDNANANSNDDNTNNVNANTNINDNANENSNDDNSNDDDANINNNDDNSNDDNANGNSNDDDDDNGNSNDDNSNDDENDDKSNDDGGSKDDDSSDDSGDDHGDDSNDD